jgi:uncharacterized membrane protein
MTTTAEPVEQAAVPPTVRERISAVPTRWRAAAPGTALRTVKSPCTWLVLAAFVLYAAFAYNQYQQLQVGACDLGIFYQAAHGWAFHLWPNVPIKGYSQIGDHFSPTFILLAPLLWVHDSPLTVVMAQAALLVASAIPIYLAIMRAWGSKTIASGITVAYLLSIGIQNSVAFPVHEVMFSAPLIAWGLERAMAGKWTAASILIGCTVFAKEDMGLLVIMFAVFALRHRKWRHALALTLWGAFMFILCLKVLIPHWNPNGFTYSNDYAKTLHSANFPDAVKYMLSHPRNTLHAIFNNPAKRDAWFHILAPVGFLCLASPIALMGLPMMLTRMLSDRDTEWGWYFYYDMPLMPIIFLGAVDGIQRISRLTRRITEMIQARRQAPEPESAETKPTEPLEAAKPLEPAEPAPTEPEVPTPATTAGRRRRLGERIAAGAFAVLTLGVTYHISEYRPLDAWLRLDAFKSDSNWVQDVHHALKYIPPGVEVRATNNLTIPLATSNTVTLVGSHVDHGDWAAIDTTNPQCPINASDIPPYVADLTAQGFTTVAKVGPILVMHKG